MRLTKIKIDRAKYQGDSDRNYREVVWDGEIPGLGVRVYPSGRKAFVLSYRTAGRKRLMTIDKFGVMTLDQARKRARILLGQIHQNADPLAERHKAAKAETVGELCEQYMKRYAIPQKKSAGDDQRRIDKHLLPIWKNHKIRSIRHQDASHLHFKLGEKSIYEANRVLALVSTIWEFARKQGFIDRTEDNPARGIEKYKEKKRTRWVTETELPILARAIAEYDNLYIRSVIWLYLLTGCRKSELLTARWDYIVDNELHLPDTKSGEPLKLPLSTAALALLKSLPREDGNPFIFPGRVPGKPLMNINKAWNRIRKAADLEDVHIHDLRRTVGSWLKQQGNDTYLVQNILNHKDSRTTERYMHFAKDHLRNPLERHGELVMKIIDQKPANLSILRKRGT